MGIHHDAWIVVYIAPDHVGRLSSHSRQGRNGVKVVIVGCHTVEEVLEAVKYYEVTDEERSYAHIFSGGNTIHMTGRCMYCNHCQPCPAHIDIAAVTKFLDLATQQDTVPETVAQHYWALSATADDCLMCGQCTAVCPMRAVSISGYDTGQIEKKEDLRLKPGEVLDVIRFRRSIRQFKQKEIPKEVISQILEAGRLTHTAKNMQDVSFVVLNKEKSRIEQMAVSLFRKIKPFADLFSPMARKNKIDEHFFFFNAPTVIVILARDKTNGILAAQNMEFVAEANGLGVLFSGFFTMAANTSPKIRRAIGIPKGKRAAMTLVLGYPDVKFLRSVQREKLIVKYM